MKSYFEGNRYDTPVEKKRLLRDKLFLNTRLYFYWRYIKVLSRARKQVRKGIYDNAAWAQSSADIFQLIEDCGCRFHVEGLDNVRQASPPVVFVANHMSMLETQILPVLIAPFMDVTFVVKKSLTTHPYFGPIMRSREPIAVARDNPRDDLKVVLSEGVDMLASGRSIIIFPQHTRSVQFDEEQFNSLGVKLAARAGVSVIPVALKSDCWGNGRIMKDLGPVHREKDIYFSFGEPIAVTGNGREQHQQVVDFIAKKSAQWADTPK